MSTIFPSFAPNAESKNLEMIEDVSRRALNYLDEYTSPETRGEWERDVYAVLTWTANYLPKPPSDHETIANAAAKAWADSRAEDLGSFSHGFWAAIAWLSGAAQDEDEDEDVS